LKFVKKEVSSLRSKLFENL